MLTLVGTIIVLIALRDVRQELFHPDARGSLSRLVAQLIWDLTRRLSVTSRRAVYSAGPAILIGIGATWVVMPACGWRSTIY